MTTQPEETGQPWALREVQATVDLYFRMLRLQEFGQAFNKSELIRELRQQLPARSTGSIEYKLRNVSAIVDQSGVPMVTGYKPLPNVQSLLVDVVSDRLLVDEELDRATLHRVETPADTPPLPDLESFVVPAPVPPRPRASEPMTRTPIKRDYLERESRNRSLGLAGEQLILEFEAKRLHAAGKRALAGRIEHVSIIRGDGLGYDIHSFDENGSDRLIEVKTTAYMAETAFFASQNEVHFSRENALTFHLYRLFLFWESPRLFIMPGALADNFVLDATNYRATLIGSN